MPKEPAKKHRSASLAYYYRKQSQSKNLLLDPFRLFNLGRFCNILTIIDKDQQHWLLLNDILLATDCHIRFSELAHRVPANVSIREFKHISLVPLPSPDHTYRANKRVRSSSRFINVYDVFHLLGALFKYDYRRFPWDNDCQLIHKLSKGGPRDIAKYRYYIRASLKDVTPEAKHLSPADPTPLPDPIIKVYTEEQLQREHNVNIPTVMTLYSLYITTQRMSPRL